MFTLSKPEKRFSVVALLVPVPVNGAGCSKRHLAEILLNVQNSDKKTTKCSILLDFGTMLDTCTLTSKTLVGSLELKLSFATSFCSVPK